MKVATKGPETERDGRLGRGSFVALRLRFSAGSIVWVMMSAIGSLAAGVMAATLSNRLMSEEILSVLVGLSVSTAVMGLFLLMRQRRLDARRQKLQRQLAPSMTRITDLIVKASRATKSV